MVLWLFGWFFLGLIASWVYTSITGEFPQSPWLWGLFGIALGLAKMLLYGVLRKE